MSAPMTDKYRLVESRLGRDLAAYLRDAQVEQQSLRKIAADLTTACDVEVSYETVRVWLDRLQVAS